MNFFQQDEENITPVIEGKRCKLYVFFLFFVLVIFPILISLYVWYEYSFLYGIGSMLFLYLVSSIVGSKLRFVSVPSKMREKSLSSFEISKWYVYKNFC